jgi:hypothetical protein
MVSGSVALDEDVENAVSSGVAMFRKWLNGLALPITLTIKGNETNAWKSSAATTQRL